MVPVLAFAVLFGCWGVSPQDDAIDPNLSLHFSIDQDGRLSAHQLSTAIGQVRLIWQPVGVKVSFGRYGEPTPLGATKISLRIVQQRRFIGETPILGWTAVTATGRPSAALFVSVTAVTELLSHVKGLLFMHRPMALRERLTGQVIGRVAAHELGHYLLQSAGHEHQGLMRPLYSADDLIGPWLHPFQVPSADRQAVRREVATLAKLQAGSR
jgi:hypothetical protein